MTAPLVQACSADIRRFGPACLRCTCGTGTFDFFSAVYTVQFDTAEWEPTFASTVPRKIGTLLLDLGSGGLDSVFYLPCTV